MFKKIRTLGVTDVDVNTHHCSTMFLCMCAPTFFRRQVRQPLTSDQTARGAVSGAHPTVVFFGFAAQLSVAAHLL